jgi:hypothetical protein
VIFLRPLDSSGKFNSFKSFPSTELFSMISASLYQQRLVSDFRVYCYILRLDLFTRFLKYSGSMKRDILFASPSRYHPSYHIILCRICRAQANVPPHSSGALAIFPVLVSRGNARTYIRKCGASSSKGGSCGRHVRSGCSAVRQREQNGRALPPRHHWEVSR